MTQTTRRSFLHQTTLAAAAAAVGAGCSTTPSAKHLAKRGPVIISTWGFGKPANELALRTLQGGGSALDAVEQGIRLVEVSGNSSVGLSGKPNAAGVPGVLPPSWRICFASHGGVSVDFSNRKYAQ